MEACEYANGGFWPEWYMCTMVSGVLAAQAHEHVVADAATQQGLHLMRLEVDMLESYVMLLVLHTQD